MSFLVPGFPYQLTQQPPPPNVVKIDLYEKYKERQKDVPNVWPSPDEFYMYLRILMSCDATHDFTDSRATDVAVDLEVKSLPNTGDATGKKELEKKAREKFIGYISELLVDDIIREQEGLSKLENVIEKIKSVNEGPEVEGLEKFPKKKGTNPPWPTGMSDRSLSLKQILKYFFTSDKKAKTTIGIILHILGIHRESASKYYFKQSPFSCEKGYNILGLLQAIHQFDGEKPGPIYIRIDQSSDKTNLIPVYGSMIDSALRRRAGCRGIKEFKCIYNLATLFDASYDDSLQTSMTYFKLVVKNLDNIEFHIKCGAHDVFKGILYLENEVVKLRINKYFNRDTDMTRDNNINKSTGLANNSVAGLTMDIIRNLGADILNTTLIAFKTAGDFLQIMCFLAGNTQNKEEMYLSFDIASSEIASVFHRNVFLENTYSEKKKVVGYTEGITIFLNDLQKREMEMSRDVLTTLTGRTVREREAAENMLELSEETIQRSMNKRARVTQFGKKSNKLKSMSNEDLKTKLKSVGINITKMSKYGKRLPLTRKEMEKKANLFKNLQLRAKKIGIKLMYKSKRRGYVYKSYRRLMNELERIKAKYISKFG